MKETVALVVFDIAGTTIADNGAIAYAFQKALEVYGYNVPTAQINLLMGYEKGEAIRQMLDVYEENRSRITTAHVRNIHHRFLQEMILYYQTTTDLKPLPGVEETF